MKKIIFILVIISSVTFAKVSAQNANLERLNNYKIGFYTKKLNLSTEEAEKFWPVYNEYQTQRNQIQLDKLKLNRTFNQSGGTLTNSQLLEIGDDYVDCLVRESNLAVAFHKKLKEVLPPAKVILYYQAENQYKVQLLNELQTVRQQQRGKLQRDF